MCDWMLFLYTLTMSDESLLILALTIIILCVFACMNFVYCTCKAIDKKMKERWEDD